MSLRIAGKLLSAGMDGDDVGRLHAALRVLGRAVPPDELGRRVYGPQTAATVGALQRELGLEGTSVLDERTISAINSALEGVGSGERVVRGRVVEESGRPVAGASVSLAVRRPGLETVLATAATDEDGAYDLRYEVPAELAGAVDLRVFVADRSGALETRPSGTSVIADAQRLEVLDFIVTPRADRGTSELEVMLSDLAPLLVGRALSDLHEGDGQHDVSLLATQSGYSTAQIAALVRAHQLARETGRLATVFYGLLRKGLPGAPEALLATDPSRRKAALAGAVAEGLVPEKLDGRPIDAFLTELSPTSGGDELADLFGDLLGASERAVFTATYLQHAGDPASFWAAIRSDSRLRDRSDRMQLAVQLGALTNLRVPLVNAVLASGRVREARDVARFTDADWRSFIDASGGAPEITPGTTSQERGETYVGQILAQIEAAFPTNYLAARLGDTPAARFLTEHPEYDLGKTYPDRFVRDNVPAARALTPEGRRELVSLQRLYRVTRKASETLALAAAGVHSAAQIARLDRDVLAARLGESVPAVRAHEIHAAAERVAATAVAVFGEYASKLDRTTLRALPRIDSTKRAELAAAAIPNWESLFGSFDLCACGECAAAHSPAAYLVDILQFLDERGVKDPLFARRPDLGEIELSCANTNTLVPTVDLVNEILEDAVAPLPAFSSFTLAAAREQDLAATKVTAELSAAFAPPLFFGARIDVVEVGARWRVYDEAYEYIVVKTGNSLDVTTRSRQTSGTSAERRAAPQYVNRAAYREMRDAVYPWSLPFDLAQTEGSVFLAHLGVARSELVAAFRATDHDDPVSPAGVVIAAESLGLSDVQRAIIVGAPHTPPRSLADYWGGALPGTSSTVRDVLDTTGLTFTELADLVATEFVDPTHLVRIRAQAGERIDTCDPTKLELTGLTSEVLERAHRFVRLQRTIDWSIRDLDRALALLADNPAAPVLDDAFLVRLAHLRALISTLRVSLPEALSLWAPLDTSGPDALYRRLFLDPLSPGVRTAAFALRADGTELALAGELASVHGEALQAVLGISAGELSMLLSANDRLTIETLSRLHRHVVLAGALGLSVGELFTAIDLTGLAPFDRRRPGDAAKLVQVVAAIRTSGFSIAQLDYLLHHRVSEASSLVPPVEESLQILEQLRQALRTAGPESSPGALIRDRIAAALDVSTEVVTGALESIEHSTRTAEHWLGELVNIDDALSASNARIQLEVLEKARKVATIVRTLSVPDRQLAWLFRENPWLAVAPDSAANVAPFASWSSFLDLAGLQRQLALEPAALDAILSRLTAVVTASDADKLAGRNALIGAFVQWLGWSAADLEALLGAAGDATDRGLLDADLTQDYRVALLVRVARVMKLLARLGVTARTANAWCESDLTVEVAASIRDAARSRHDREDWLRIAPALQDELRDRQRAALVDYLVYRPGAWGTTSPGASARDLFAHFLIDVEMTACQQSSRIKQAIGSVQLFAQRALLGLEPGVATTDARWGQWQWMKSFRLWEANRKVWLYPENFIEPELRDNKTPEFRELEEELQQADLDDASAETAVRNYLEKLDQLARLEVVGVYEDEDRVLHVFGRTDHAPRRLFYRRRAKSLWTPWERVPVEVEGDHLIPVRWNRRLMLIWPVFAEKAFSKRVVNPPPGGTLDEAERYWEIRLAWAEYQNGSWTGPNLSEPVSLVAYQDESQILFGERRELSGTAARSGVAARPVRPLGPDPGTRPPSGPVVSPPQGIPNTSPGPRNLVGTELFVFKALAQEEVLSVRGYLRRDYRGQTSSTDREIACVFGEFRFEGCRKIVSTAHVGQISRRNLALAPTGTMFDRMWFTQTSSSLVVFDGTFPTLLEPPPETFLSEENRPGSIAGDPSSVLENKLDISVLQRAPSPFRILAPHQDLQFVCDRPFFYSDRRRGFMVTSTGHSERLELPDLVEWVAADVGTMARARFFGRPSPLPAEAVAAPLSLLVGDGTGRRVSKELPPINLRPAFRPRTLFPFFSTSRRYRFEAFSHPYACAFVETIDKHGIPGLLSLETQSLANPTSFDAYAPTGRVDKPYPNDDVDLEPGGAFELYNWELFFHIPLLVAERLRANQRFGDAQRWFHYIFDPTGSSPGDAPQRYWRTKPFHDRLTAEYEAESVKVLEELIASGPTPALSAAVQAWRDNPFSPHAIARLRTTAYQKTVVMKYLDNLIGWGDQLFARDTLESINEATQLYILAAEVLGREPEIIDRHVEAIASTFNSLTLSPGGLANALEQIELLVGVTEAPTSESAASGDATASAALVFCVPENARLLGYWSTVADRLFKIRTCRNLAGLVRQLPLFEPPIDPALLVRARAAGIDIADLAGNAAIGLPPYRFSAAQQRATELAADVRNLGTTLLSVLEKRDGERLATLRSEQEVKLLQAVRDVRTRQIDEAKANLSALQQSHASALARKSHYETREPVNEKERASLTSLRSSFRLLARSAGLQELAAGLHLLGVIKLGSPTTAGLEIGPSHVANALVDGASVMDVRANLASARSRVAGTEGDLQRRREEWALQAAVAGLEVRQIEQQIVASEIRLAIAESELRNHERQVEQARDVDQMLRSKFTRHDLYQHSVSQLSGLHFQTYSLACELAKRAERCLQHELGLEYGSTSYVRMGQWDSLRQGLWAGEHLAHDLRRLELAYADGNTREYELTKHISLEALAPEQLLVLKTTGACEMSIPEWVFDLDTPGHVMRRIKSVSLTLPCVTGPFTTVHCKLTLLASTYRRTSDLTSGYARTDPDSRFIDGRGISDTVVTSTGQNDSGLFEANPRDERYLPFEGAGADSRWRLELPTAYKTFDHDTISDVVLHMRYTARDGGEAVRAAASSEVKRLFGSAGTLARMFSLRHDFPTAWHTLVSGSSAVRSVTVDLAASRFPFFTRDRTIRVRSAEVAVSAPDPAAAAIQPGENAPGAAAGPWTGAHAPGPWTISTAADPAQLEDLWIILSYTIDG